MDLDRATYFTVIAIIAAALITGFFTWWYSDFSISVNPMVGEVGAGDLITTNVTINRQHLYSYEVYLDAENPDKFNFTFNPVSKKGLSSFSSTLMMIPNPDLPGGDYDIIISGLGADGRQHVCTYILTVTRPKIVVEIIDPVDGDLFSRTSDEVKGIQENIPDGYYLCIFGKNPGDNLYYPSSDIDLSSRNWVYTIQIIGEEDDIGKEFEILAVIMDENARMDVENIRSKWPDNYYGLINLPEGSEVLDHVYVELSP